MPDVTLPSGLVKPAVSSTAYGPKLNANWDLIDGLFDRVTTLEGLHGGGIVNYWPVPPGSTWDEAQAIITAAQDLAVTVPNQIVVLPNEQIYMTAGVYTGSGRIRITGAGPLSELVVDANTVVNGSDGLFNIVTGIELDHFKVTFDRVSLGSSSRRTAMYVNWGAWNVDLHHLTINGCTSDVFHLACEYAINGFDIANVRIWSNSATEWYESFCILREGDISNVKVFDNTGVTTTRHPNGGVSAPYGVGCDAESLYGVMKDITFENNNMDSTGVAGSGSTPGFGIFCAWSSGGTDVGNLGTQDFAGVANRVTFKNNTCAGFYYNTLHTLQNFASDFTSESVVIYEGNTGSGYTSATNALYQPQNGDADDNLVLIKNVGGKTIDLTALGSYAGPTITEVDDP